MSWIRRKLWLLAAAMLPASATGCNPLAMGFFTPIPVQPWVAERMQDKYQHKNDGRVPIMPPIRDGFPAPICEDPPSDQEVLRAMPRVPRGVPWVYETFRDDIVIVKNRLVDKIDPPRFFPLVGPAQLHHCHWECVIYYTETGRTGGAYLQDVNGDNILDWVALNDPRVYEEGRNVRMGLSITF